MLSYLALFKRFGSGPTVIVEAQSIAKLIAQTEPQITWGRFQQIIRNLKERKTLQGREHLIYHTEGTACLFVD